MAKTSSYIIAGLAGLAAGLALGVLFAPEKGSKVRKKIRKKFSDLADNVSSGVSGITGKAEDFARGKTGKSHPAGQ